MGRTSISKVDPVHREEAYTDQSQNRFGEILGGLATIVQVQVPTLKLILIHIQLSSKIKKRKTAFLFICALRLSVPLAQRARYLILSSRITSVIGAEYSIGCA